MYKDDKKEKIDFVILWVDGNDKEWLEEKAKYSNLNGDSSINRFRDYDNLQYLFRGIEKFVPWVNKIFFVTWGHIPKWMNTNNEKIVVVKHEDFIPKEYLPTFNSNVIEMNLHRIEDLSEKFVLLNDDLFILKQVKKSDFFKKGLPRDMYIEHVKYNPSDRHKKMRRNYINIINKYFSKKEYIKKNCFKVFNIEYGLKNFKTLINLKNEDFCDLYSPHLTQAFLKSTFKDLWVCEETKINEACYNKLRADNDLGVMLCRYWQLLNGRFMPSKIIGKYFDISNNNKNIIKCIKKNKYKIICINDSRDIIDFEKVKHEINEAFNSVLNSKSQFEI